MVYMILAIFFALIGLIIISSGIGTVGGVFVIICSIMLFLSGVRKRKIKKQLKNEKKQREETMREKDCVWNARLPHITGLPISENLMCDLYYSANMLFINGGGHEFELAGDRLRDITITTDEEIQKNYVSSVGGAVGGMVLFGPLGAMIGGRAKAKTSKIVTNILIFTYNKDGEVKYIGFNVTQNLNEANKLKALFETKQTQATKVQL